jgi:hypothetical protein
MSDAGNILGNVQMRWLERRVVGAVAGRVEDSVRVLQYRQLIDMTVYAHARNNALSRQWIEQGGRHLEWSEWTDVPLVVESEKG